MTGHVGRSGLLLLFGAAVGLVPAAAPVARGNPSLTPASAVGVPCPTDGVPVAAGSPLQPIVDRASPSAVLCLAPGHYQGPVVIRARLTLQGPADAVLQSDGLGTTLRVLADRVTVSGFTVEGSGRRYDKMDAAVYVRGTEVTVRSLMIRDALFGIVAEQSDHVTIATNHIIGLAALPVGIRGDGIRLWEVRHSVVRGNRLEDSRDILVWYSPDNLIAGNTVERSRYATHFMYSDDCVVEQANYRANEVGVFVMYSRGVSLLHSTIADNAAGGGLGLGVKESGNLLVEGNRFLHDGACLYLDTSPFREGDSVLVRGNAFVRCTAGVTFHSTEHRNAFLDNAFEGNQTQVAVEGRGTAQGVIWRRNYFDDYQGYDLNRDGVGDLPYEVRDLSERLVAERPQLAYFRGTIAFDLLNVAGRVFPILEPETLLIDRTPRMRPPPIGREHEEPQ